MPARSPLRSSAGPEVTRASLPSSWAMTWASVVLPRPGGPDSSTWSSVPAALLGGGHVDRQVLGHLALADELRERLRAKRGVLVLLGLGRRGVHQALTRRSGGRRRGGLGLARPSSWRLRAMVARHFLRRAASACLMRSAAG